MSKTSILKPGWKIWRFDQMATNVNVRIDNPAESGMKHYVGLEHLDTDSLKIRRWGKPTDVEAGKLMFKKGDIIFAKRRAYQRKLGVAEFDGICSAHAMVLRAKSEVVLPEFLPFFMQSDLFMNRAIEISVGSLSPTINWKTMAVQEFALPPWAVQEKLLSCLMAFETALLFSESLRNAGIALRRALMIDHFEAKYKSYTRVSDVGVWHSGGTPARGNSDFWGGGISWFSPKDMKVAALAKSEETLTEKGVAVGLKILPMNTIMIVVRGMILAHTFPVARTLVPAACNQDMKALVVGGDFLPKYIQYWFEYAAPQYLRLVSESTHGTKRLETDKLFSLAIPKIPIEKQASFISTVDDMHMVERNAAKRHTILLEMKRAFLGNQLAEMPLKSH